LRFLDRLQPFALLVLRLVLGIIFIMHGKAKIFGGLAHHLDTVASLGMPRWMGYLSSGTEFFGGMLLVIGLFTRFVGIAGCIEMCVAIAKIHFKHGLVGQGGYEFPLALAAINFALIWFGAGPISVDWFFGRRKGRG
jgi:putative oxidoreductase